MTILCYYGGICTNKGGLCYIDCPKYKSVIANGTTNKTSYEKNGYIQRNR